MKKIENETFRNCTNLKKVEIKNGVECVGERCFEGHGIEEIVLPGTLKNISRKAISDVNRPVIIWTEDDCAADVLSAAGNIAEVFSKSSRLWGEPLWDLRRQRVIAIPENVEFVGERLFCYCEVESVTIPATVREIRDNAFYGCKRLRNVIFSEGS